MLIYVRKSTAILFLSAPFLICNVTHSADFTINTVAEFQNALQVSNNNGESDVIHVATGTYLLSTPLQYSCNDGDGNLSIVAVNPSAPPVLDGEATTRILYINNDADNDQAGDSQTTIAIRNLVFHNGHYASYGGGLLIRTGMADIVIDSCVFSNNWAEYSGGGAYIFTNRLANGQQKYIFQ